MKNKELLENYRNQRELLQAKFSEFLELYYDGQINENELSQLNNKNNKDLKDLKNKFFNDRAKLNNWE